MKMCASRVGQLLNLWSTALDDEVDRFVTAVEDAGLRVPRAWKKKVQIFWPVMH